MTIWERRRGENATHERRGGASLKWERERILRVSWHVSLSLSPLLVEGVGACGYCKHDFIVPFLAPLSMRIRNWKGTKCGRAAI